MLLLWLAVVFSSFRIFFFILVHVSLFFFFRERFVRAWAYVHRIFNTSLLIFIQYIISLFLLLLLLLKLLLEEEEMLVIGWLVGWLAGCLHQSLSSFIYSIRFDYAI